MTAAARAQHALAGANDPNLENFSKQGAEALLGPVCDIRITLDAIVGRMRSPRGVRAVLLRALAPSLVCSFGCSTPPPLRPDTQDPSVEQRELEETFGARKALGTFHGEASYYSDALAGRKTASGEPYDPQKYTAAHRSLPFGTVLRVRRDDTGGIVYVRVNDRGPFGKRRRILDLSKAAAQQLGMIRRGIAEVRIEVVERAKQ